MIAKQEIAIIESAAMANSFRSDGSHWVSVVSDPRVEGLARAGRVRVALFPSFVYTKDPVTGDLRGVGIEIARALSARLGVEFLPVEYSAPPKVMEGLNAGTCDVGFLGIDPSRIDEVDFSPPLMQVDWSYLVPAGSSIHSVADADRPGVRIAVVRNHAMDLALRRILKHAEPVRAETPDGTFDVLRAGHADVQAGVRPALLEYSARLPGSRVLEDRYGANSVAMVVPKGQGERLAYISGFVEEAKALGLMQRAIEHAGLRGILVAPRETLNTPK
jgi:polar amino acid transport system substrate-binding protein